VNRTQGQALRTGSGDLAAIGLVHPLAQQAGPTGQPPTAAHVLAAVGLVLVLKAFSAGCSALTGVEAGRLCHTHRSFVARTAAWTRFRTSSLRRISWMCVFTVFSLR